MTATATRRPTFVILGTVEKSATEQTWRTEKAAQRAADRASFGRNVDAYVVTSQDGNGGHVFAVHTRLTVAPAPETTRCVDCGASVPTITTGQGSFDGENCPASTSTSFPRHRVNRDVYDAALQYEQAATLAAQGNPLVITVGQ